MEENIESTGGSVLLDLERIRDIFGIESEAKRAFRAIDRNGDGAISTNELAELLRLNGTASTEEQVMQLKRKYDKDADGKISFEVNFFRLFRLSVCLVCVWICRIIIAT